jgi:hypothetical protein
VRQDLFSAPSVLVRLPCVVMKCKAEDYVLCSICITDAYLIVDQREPAQVACEDAGAKCFPLHPWQSVARTAHWISNVA